MKGAERRRQVSTLGFTLIELLVVIAIIATLAAILFPVFLSAKDASLQAKCTSNLRQIYKGWNMYLQDWGGRVPRSIVGDCVGWGDWRLSNDPNRMGWTEKIYGYTKNIAIYHCPKTKLNFSYALNSTLCTPPNTNPGTTPPRAIEPLRPSKTICIFEVPSYDEKDPTYGRARISLYGPNNKGTTGDSDLTNDNQKDMWCYGEINRLRDGHPIEEEARYPFAYPGRHFAWLYFPGRHKAGNNICFYDGHVKWFSDWDGKYMTFDPMKP